MALTAYTSGTVTSLVAKPINGSKYAGLYAPSAEDANKFDYAHAKVVATYDAAAMVWNVLFIDITSYYP